MAEQKKRSKSFYVNKAKRPKLEGGRVSLNELKDSKEGIFVTANFLGSKCYSEIFRLLDEMYEKFYPKDCKHETGDVEDDIKNEIAELAQKKTFEAIDTTLNNIMFVLCNDPAVNVTDFVSKIFQDILSTKKRKTRFTQRILPVSYTCYASMTDIEKTAKVMLSKMFHNDNKMTYAIVYKSRNNTEMKKKRDDVIKLIAEIVTNKTEFAAVNTVNLDNPEYAIIVNVVKNIVFMSTITDYYLHHKYNIDELTKSFAVSDDNRVKLPNESDEISREVDVVKNKSEDVVEKENKSEDVVQNADTSKS